MTGLVEDTTHYYRYYATNAFGEVYMDRNKEMLNDYPPYGQAAVPASCLRNHLMLKEMKEGRGPIWMDTVTALANLRETLSPREVKHLEAEVVEELPEAVFVRGHVLQVARALGLADPNELAARYLAKVKLD